MGRPDRFRRLRAVSPQPASLVISSWPPHGAALGARLVWLVLYVYICAPINRDGAMERREQLPRRRLRVSASSGKPVRQRFVAIDLLVATSVKCQR